MAFRKAICIAGLASIICVQLGVGQNGQFAQMPQSGDPFALSPGSSFSASGSNPAGGGSVGRREMISADLNEAIAVISRNHIGGKQVNNAGLTESAITSMLHVLDPHSSYYNPDQFQQLLGEHESEYMGTGSSIAGFEQNGRLETYIVSTFAESSAAKARLRFGDRIVAVDGRKVSGELPDTVRDLVRGKRGTLVRLTVERADSRSLETVEMKRDRVHEPAVPKGFVLNGNVGFIDVTAGFSNATFGEFEASLNDLKRRGIGSLVIDLRGNGGGILDQAVKIAEKFLPQGSLIVSQQGRYSDDTRTWKASKAFYESMPLVLLVDEGTASASEVLAGALQDNDRALIVGRKTFGKGLVQSVLNLPEGAGLTLTAARYYTPTGRSIQRDYAATGLYDYYNHRTVEIDKPAFAARTITNRVVYGGDGITPDETVSNSDISTERMSLLDPIFFFARDLNTGRLSTTAGRLPAADILQQLHHRITLGQPVVNDEVLEQFTEFTNRDASWAPLKASIERNNAFVTRMLAYYIAMSTFGPEKADRARIEDDEQVKQAIRSIPKSANLTAAAEKARRAAKKEKSSLSLVLNEQR